MAEDSSRPPLALLNTQYSMFLYPTFDDKGVNVEGVVGGVDVSLLVVLLAEREGAAVHANVVDISIAPHCGLR